MKKTPINWSSALTRSDWYTGYTGNRYQYQATNEQTKEGTNE